MSTPAPYILFPVATPIITIENSESHPVNHSYKVPRTSMAVHSPSSTSSTLANEKMHDPTSPNVLANSEKHSLEQSRSRNEETDANIFPETEATAEADLEKQDAAPPKPVIGGVNPADFPDGGLEAWLVVLGGWCALFCK